METQKLNTGAASPLQKIVIPGAKIRFFQGEGHICNALLHIKTIVDGDQVVFKRWLKYKQCWLYEVKSMYYFELRQDILTKV